MSLKKRISVSCAGLDSEHLYFQTQEAERIKALKTRSEEESNNEYKEEHKYHCFRCGTASLVEVENRGVKIDVCVNPECGAVHLDPGELDALLEQDAGTIKRVHLAVLGIFK